MVTRFFFLHVKNSFDTAGWKLTLISKYINSPLSLKRPAEVARMCLILVNPDTGESEGLGDLF